MKIYYKTAKEETEITNTETLFNLLQDCNPEMYKYQVVGSLDDKFYSLTVSMFFIEKEVFDKATTGLYLEGKLTRLREELLAFLGKKESDLNGSYLRQINNSAFHEWI
jgi:hypothetical protein